jgi:hypothetical protein
VVTAQDARVPLSVEHFAPIYNETLTEALSSDHGGCLVHVLSYNGTIYPPAMDGAPHPSNTVLFTARIGQGVNTAKMPGAFAISLIPRPVEPFFIRVYNSIYLELATFYEDSNIHYPVIGVDAPFYPHLTATTNAIQTSDDNNDGIINSWATTLGLDPAADHGDTDGDGVRDRDELAMGTDPFNSEDFMPDILMNMANNLVMAGWNLRTSHNELALSALNITTATVNDVNQVFAGTPYRLEQASSLGDWTNAIEGVIGADGQWPLSFVLPVTTNDTGFFRMKLP